MFWKFFNQWLDPFIDGSYADTWTSLGVAFLPPAVVIAIIYYVHSLWEEGSLLAVFLCGLGTYVGIASGFYILQAGGPIWLSLLSGFACLFTGVNCIGGFNYRDRNDD